MIGIHVDKGKSKTFLGALRLFCEPRNLQCAQIFTSAPRSYHICITDNEKDDIRRYVNSTGFHLYVHLSYVLHPWSISKSKDISMRTLYDELAITEHLGAMGGVLHLPHEIIPQSEIDALPPSPVLMLEAMPTKYYKNRPADGQDDYNVCEIISQIGRRVVPDTAHLHGSGIDLTDIPGIRTWFECVQNIGLIHLNGSTADIGSGLDRHAIIGTESDAIWGRNFDGCAEIIRIAQQRNIDIIMEPKKYDDNDVTYMLARANAARYR